MGNSGSKDSVVSLNELIGKYRLDLPKLVTVGNNSKCTVSLKKGQILSLQFIKETNVISIEDKNNCTYLVPVQSSSLLCSVLYNPHGDDERAKRGTWFRGVREVILSTPRPQIVYIERDCKSICRAWCPAKEGAILAIEKVDVVPSLRSGRKVLTCIDVKSGQTLHLSESCEAIFSTRVSRLKVEIPSLLQFVSLLLPVVIYLTREDSFKLLCTMTSKCFKTTSVIASTHLHDKLELGKMVEILTDSRFEFEVLQFGATKNFPPPKIENFSPLSVTEVIGNVKSLANTQIQTYLFQNVDKNGYSLRPINSKNRDFPSTTIPLTEADSISNDHIYEQIDEGCTVDSRVTATYENHTVLVAQNDTKQKKKHSGSQSVVEAPYVNISEWFQSDHEESLPCHADTTTSVSDSRGERNKELLSQCTVKDISKLLDALNIPSNYKEAFEREGVTGRLLMGCDEELLKYDLGLSRRIDRLKILQLIEGHSDLMITQLLNQQ